MSVAARGRDLWPGAHHALMAALGAKGCPERDRGAMALQQPPLALRAGSASALYIHSMPAWVLEDFCQKMDCLSDYDWMRFGEGPWGRWGGDGAGAGAQGQQRFWDVLEGRELRAGFALSPTLPSARQRTSCKQGIPGHRSGFAFRTQVECQTSVVPGQPGSFPSLSAIFCSSFSGHPLSPATSHCLFSQRPSDLLRRSIFFFPPSLHVYSLILSAPIYLGPGCVQSVSTENIVPELFTPFSVSQCKQF